MSKWMSVFVAAVVAMSFTVSAPAQCGKGSSVRSGEMDIGACPIMSKLNLTDEQKVKVQALCDQCRKEGCTKEAWDQMSKELETVLTPEQMTQFKTSCEEMKAKGMCGAKAGKSSCPMKPSEKPVEESK